VKTDLFTLGILGAAAYLLLESSGYASSSSSLPYSSGGGYPTSGGGSRTPGTTSDPLMTDVSNIISEDGKQIIEAAGGAIAAIGTAAVSAGTTLGSAMVALATNPITWAVAGAIGIGYLWWRSQAHHQADEWVQGFQNPFDKTMGSIDDHIVSGAITDNQAFCLKQAAVADYLEAMKNFAAQGDNQALVIRQATETFIYWYKSDPDTYLANIRTWLDTVGYQCV
jgi:hypothetical protein